MVIGESLNAIENYYYSFVLLIYLDRINFDLDLDLFNLWQEYCNITKEKQ